MNVTKLRKFLGWCAVLNMSFLAVSWIYFLIAKDFGYIVLTDFFDLLVSYDGLGNCRNMESINLCLVYHSLFCYKNCRKSIEASSIA